jgi:NitT/TauT family transport system substrate-binding protein
VPADFRGEKVATPEFGNTQDVACRARLAAKAHAELTIWINQNPVEARKIVREELAFEMKRDFSEELIERSWQRLHFVSGISREPFDHFLSDAQKVGYLREPLDLSRLVEVP